MNFLTNMGKLKIQTKNLTNMGKSPIKKKARVVEAAAIPSRIFSNRLSASSADEPMFESSNQAPSTSRNFIQKRKVTNLPSIDDKFQFIMKRWFINVYFLIAER